MSTYTFIRLHSRPTRADRGFTLIEVMVVVAIIAILASVALPSYNDYVRRGQIQEAFTNLSSYRIKLEQYYQDNRAYGSATTCGGAAAVALTSTDLKGDTTYFDYTCAPTDATAQAYSITATGKAGQATGHVYTANQNGDRATTKFKGSTVTATCWLTRSATC